MRLSEAAGLHVDDINVRNEIPFINLKANPWRPLKTKSSERQVRKRLRELLGEPVQKRVGHHNARTRGFVGYIIIEDRDDDRPF